MKIAGATLTPIRLSLRQPLETAHETLNVREGWLLALSARDGDHGELCGWGEASPIAGFGMEDPAACGASLRELARHLVGRDAGALDQLLDECDALAPDAPGARGAVDTALHDLRARAAGNSIASWLRARAGNAQAPPLDIETNGLLVFDPQADSRLDPTSSLVRARRDGYRTFKLKLGRHGLDDDIACVRATARALEPGERLRLDVNGAWSLREAQAALTALAPLPIEFVEQPVAAHELAGMACLRHSVLVPIAADEGATGVAAVRALIERGAVDVIVLKPAAAGGLRASMRIASAARDASVGIVVTSLLDSAIGRAAALQLAAALPGTLPACGLATGDLFEEDVARVSMPEGGRIPVPVAPGLGLDPEPDRLARLRAGAVETFRS